MASIQVKQTSLGKKKSLLRARAVNAMQDVKIALKQTALDIVLDAMVYPPPPSDPPKYERTFTLLQGWPDGLGNVEENADGSFSIEITNSATDPDGRSYASLVQDEDDQLELHRNTGWRTIQDIQKAHATAQGNRVRRAIRKNMIK